MNPCKKMFRMRLALLLSALLLVLAVALMFPVTAAGTDPDLMMEFDPEQCSATLIYGTERIDMVSGKVYSIPTGSSVTVLVQPKDGFELTDIENKDAPGSSLMTNDRFSRETFSQSVNGIIRCGYRSFDLRFVGEGLSARPYHPESENETELNNQKYTYNEDYVLPKVIRTGYAFDHWELLDSTGKSYQKIINKNAEDRYYIPKYLFNDDMDSSGTIYAYAVFTPVKQPVLRYDYRYDPYAPPQFHGKLLGRTEWAEDMAKIITALTRMSDDPEDGYKSYVGYELLEEGMEDYHYPTHQITVPTELQSSPNVVYRLYKAIDYVLTYRNPDGSTLTMPAGTPSQYTFNTRTVIPDPTRVGYTFRGWIMTVKAADGTEIRYENLNPGFVLGTEDDNLTNYISADKEIVLTACWEANTYEIGYTWNGKNDEQNTLLDTINAALPRSFVFDDENGISVPDPVRAGYTFVKWILHTSAGTEELTSENGVLKLSAGVYAENIRLEAVWEAKHYRVVLDDQNATTPGTGSIADVIFDQPFVLPVSPAFVCPSRMGFDFAGFYSEPDGKGTLYINANGESVCTAWDLSQADEEGNITLYAAWVRKSYPVSVVIDGTDDATVIIRTEDGTEYPYTGTPILLPYETRFTVIIRSPAGYKTVKWNGTVLSEHTVSYTSPVQTVGVEEIQLRATVLPTITVPTVRINYFNETFVLPAGSYLIRFGSVSLRVTVSSSGNITVDGKGETGVTVPDSFFGNTIQIIAFGDCTTTSDSDPADLQVVGRADMPTWYDITTGKGDIYVIKNLYDTKLIVQMLEERASLFEFACRASSASGAALVWQDSGTFEGLYPGTEYCIYIRLKATEDAPHGKELELRYSTLIQSYLPSKLEELEDLRKDDDGELAKGVIDEAIRKINEEAAKTPLDPDFYQIVERIVEDAKAKIAFARYQDKKIAELRELLRSYTASGLFSEDSLNRMKTIVATAEASIIAATTESEADAITATAKSTMELIPVTYLFSRDGLLRLIAKYGLAQGSYLTLVRQEDFETLAAAISEAIRTSGRVTVSASGMTLAEAEELLRGLDVVGVYSFSLLTTTKNEKNSYEIRLQIPEEMRSLSGLTVAYYDRTTGVVELLECRRDGDELVFTADHVSDFVIFADPTVLLTPVIAVLGVIVLCQLIAIAVLLSARHQGKRREARLSAVALPMLLTVRFLPENAMLIVCILGGAAVLLQIFLVYLLLTSEVFFRRHPGHDDDDRGYHPALPTMADPEPHPGDSADSDADVAEEADGADGADGTEGTEEDPFAVYDEEPGYGEPYMTEETDEADGTGHGEPEEISDSAETLTEETPDEEFSDAESLDYTEFSDDAGAEPFDGEDLDPDAADATDATDADSDGDVYGESDEDFIEPAANPYYSMEDTDTDPTYEESDDEDRTETDAPESYPSESYDYVPQDEFSWGDDVIPEDDGRDPFSSDADATETQETNLQDGEPASGDKTDNGADSVSDDKDFYWHSEE